MSKRNPYHIDRYADVERPGVGGAVSNAVGLVGCLVAMAVLCIGMMVVLWKVSGK